MQSMQKALRFFSVVMFVLAINVLIDLAFFKHDHFGSVKAQTAGDRLKPIKGSEPITPSIKSSSVAKHDYTSNVVVVNLPPGEKFLYIIPKEQAAGMHLSSRGDDAYVTVTRAPGEPARRITIWGPGSMPHSWEPLLHIQEH